MAFSRAWISGVSKPESSANQTTLQRHRLCQPHVLLCVIVTAAVCGLQIWIYIRAAMSILRLNSDSSQENRGVKSSILWAQLVFCLYGIITAMGVLGWVKLARRASPVANFLLFVSAMSALINIAMAFTNLMVIFAFKKEVSIRCHWAFDFTWIDTQDECATTSSSEFRSWVLAGVIRFLATIIIVVLWLFSIRTVKKKLPIITMTPIEGVANKHESEIGSSKRPALRDNMSSSSTVQASSSDRLQTTQEDLDEHAIEHLCFPESPQRCREGESCRCSNSETSSLHGTRLIRLSPSCRQHGWVDMVYNTNDKSGAMEDGTRVREHNHDSSGRSRAPSLPLLSRRTWSTGSRPKTMFDVHSQSPEEQLEDRQMRPAILVIGESWNEEEEDLGLVSPTSTSELPDPTLRIHSESPSPSLQQVDGQMTHATFVKMDDGRLARRLSTIISLGSQEDCRTNFSGRARDSFVGY